MGGQRHATAALLQWKSR